MTAPALGRGAIGLQRSRGAVAAGESGPRMSPRLARVALAVISCGLALLFAREMLIVWSVPDADLLDPFNDANTYMAAGERLNDGRLLYELQPGDRPVLLEPGNPVPLLSPPAIAAIWRPLAAVPFGHALWVAAAWASLLGTVVYLVMKLGLRAAVVAAALCFPIGEQLVAANLTAFFPGLLVLTWRYREHPRAGAIIGVMAGLKIAPAVMGGWFIGVNRVRGLVWMLAGGIAVATVGLIGAGVSANLEYATMIPMIPPSTMSLSGQTGIRWLSPAALVAGTLAAAVLWRWPRLSFVVGVVTLILASPALFPTTFTLLLAALAPLIPDPAPGASPFPRIAGVVTMFRYRPLTDR